MGTYIPIYKSEGVTGFPNGVCLLEKQSYKLGNVLAKGTVYAWALMHLSFCFVGPDEGIA